MILRSYMLSQSKIRDYRTWQITAMLKRAQHNPIQETVSHLVLIYFDTLSSLQRATLFWGFLAKIWCHISPHLYYMSYLIDAIILIYSEDLHYLLLSTSSLLGPTCFSLFGSQITRINVLSLECEIKFHTYRILTDKIIVFV